MKKCLLGYVLVVISLISFGQETVTTNVKALFSCSQEYGLAITEGDYLLTVVFDETNLKYSTREGLPMASYTVTEKTDKYVIGIDGRKNSAFFDIGKKQFFYIDYFMNDYRISGFGANDSGIQQEVLKMMDMLKAGSSQIEVIQYLVKQTE